jgi:hypothetical protein
MLRRELLAIVVHSYRFCTKARGRVWRMWPAVLTELRQAAHLICFAFVDTQRPTDPRVLATDASGASETAHGGFGVVEQLWEPSRAEHIMSMAEKWRYSVAGAVTARAQALGLAAV